MGVGVGTQGVLIRLLRQITVLDLVRSQAPLPLNTLSILKVINEGQDCSVLIPTLLFRTERKRRDAGPRTPLSLQDIQQTEIRERLLRRC